tara:strand:+ start:408 stop:803 length:396 start_codon:yes stop_codon:yes gene_type:complete
MKDRDLDHIAGLEKAIKKKYGNEAIQNPASCWDEKKEAEYLEQLQDFVEKQQKYETYSKPENVNGVLITQKLFSKDKKIICPVCCGRLKTVYDELFNTKFECCYECYIKYVEDREDRWLKGWRPKNVTKST